VVEAVARGLFGVLAALVLFIVTMALTANREISRGWPGLLIAMGFVGLVPVLWGWLSGRLGPARLRWLLVLCLLAIVGGIFLLAVDHHGRMARGLFFVGWPVGLLLFFGFEIALLCWAFHQSGQRWAWAVVAGMVVVLLLIVLAWLGMASVRQAHHRAAAVRALAM
jgi:hypothetical protein